MAAHGRGISCVGLLQNITCILAILLSVDSIPICWLDPIQSFARVAQRLLVGPGCACRVSSAAAKKISRSQWDSCMQSLLA